MRRHPDFSAYAFLAPYMALYALFMLLPAAWSFALSLRSGGLLEGTRFVGFSNYAEVWANPFFFMALRNTAYYTALTVPGAMLLSLSTALLLHPSVAAGRT